MILQLFLIFLLLWQTVGNTLIQSSSLANSVCIEISFRLPLSAETIDKYGIHNWFLTNYLSLAGKSDVIDNIDLEVRESSLGEDKRAYGVRYCQTAGIPSPFKIVNESSGSMNQGGGTLQECKYALFLEQRWFEYFTKVNPCISKQDLMDFCQLFDWNIMRKFSFTLFPIDQNASNWLFFNLQCDRCDGETVLSLRGKKIGDESNGSKTTSRESMIYENWIGYYKLYNRRVLSAIGASLGGLFILLGRSYLIIFIKKTKKSKLRKFFKMKAERVLNSYDGSVDRYKQFSAKELDKATDHFNENRFLGQGGQGTVYRGILEDGRIIAVKQSKIVHKEKLEEFVNELVILSQINHRNVVKLFGCCLETEIPLLVYEFIPNGTLFEYIHNRNEELPLTWEMRLRIAKEVAGALSYLHSSAAIPIYHRDIKSTNILLDENYSAKVADFGISKVVSIDQTHVTTKILGTYGYLDPEYYQSSQLTDKSDVYSFGVVLVELLTGEKPIFSSGSQEYINLAKYFIYAMKENRLHDILDDQVKKTGKKGEIMTFANLTKRCLNVKGRERPTMKEVAAELEGIRVLKKKKRLFNKIMKYFQ